MNDVEYNANCIRWLPTPIPSSSEVGTRILLLDYVKDFANAKIIAKQINELVNNHLEHMQLKCDKCYTAYSLDDMVCGSGTGYGCGQKTLKIVHKTIDDELVGRLRVECQNKMCGKTYYPPRERIATCEQHPDNNLSYLLNGNDQTELLPIMCMAVADPEIRSTTNYFKAACGAKSAYQALDWLGAHGLVKKRRIGVHTKNLHDPYLYTETEKGKQWFESKMSLFNDYGLNRLFEDFVGYRMVQLKKLEVPEEIKLNSFIKYNLRLKNTPKHLNKFFKKALLDGLNSNILPENTFKWLKSAYVKRMAKGETFISNKEGVIWNYKLMIPVRKNKEVMHVRHVPNVFLGSVFQNDKKNVWGN